MNDIRLNAVYEQQGHEFPLLMTIEALRSINELTAISAAASGLSAGSMSHRILAPKRGSFELIVLLHAVLPQVLGRLFSMNEAEGSRPGDAVNGAAA